MECTCGKKAEYTCDQCEEPVCEDCAVKAEGSTYQDYLVPGTVYHEECIEEAAGVSDL